MYGECVGPQHEHGEEPEEAEDVAHEEREPRAVAVDQLGRPRRDEHHADDGRQDRGPGFERRVAEHVLQELLTDEHRAHQRPEHDDARAGGDPEGAPRRDVQVVQRRPARGAAACTNPPSASDREDHEEEHRRALVRHRREVDREHDRRDEHHREDAAEVVDRLGGLVHVRGDEEERQPERDHGQRKGDRGTPSPTRIRRAASRR